MENQNFVLKLKIQRTLETPKRNSNFGNDFRPTW